MAISYPVAATVPEALATRKLALTAAEAARMVGAEVEFVSEWAPAASVGDRMEHGLRHGFVQLYEDHGGTLVCAISYWRSKQEPVVPVAPRLKRRRSHSGQLELFAGPDQGGYERRDPANPAIILVEEEGDGARFGGPRR